LQNQAGVDIEQPAIVSTHGTATQLKGGSILVLQPVEDT